MGPLIVEPIKVEIERVLPCAVEKLREFAWSVEAYTVDAVNIFPCAVE